MEPRQNDVSSGQFIYLSRNSKLARIFQDSATIRTPPARQMPVGPEQIGSRMPMARPAGTACPKLQSVSNPSLELTRPLAAALMREQAGMRCKVRGVMLDNEYVRDVCSGGSHQHCPFLKD